VVGFALDVEGRMRDAVPIDKARGQAVFEDITRARVDPGLLQATEGNNYKVRVYPIPADGTRRILVRYVESLGARGKERVYRLPLAYARGVRDLFFEARVEGEAPRVVAAGTLGELGFHRVGNGWRAAVKRSGAAGGMVELAIPERSATRASVQMFRDAAYFHAEGRVRVALRERTLPRVLQLAWDSSGSMAARDFARERALLDTYFSAARDIEVHLVRVRDAAEPTATFHVRNGDWSALRKALEETSYDGGTNLAAIPEDRAAGEVLLFSDGLANFGDGNLVARTIPVFAVSSVAGTARGLRNTAEAGGGRFIDLLVDSPAVAREKLLTASAHIAALDGDGVRDLVSATPILTDGRFAIAGIATAPRARVRVTIAHADGSPRGRQARGWQSRRRGTARGDDVGDVEASRPRSGPRPQSRRDPPHRPRIRPGDARDLAHRARARRGLRSLRGRAARGARRHVCAPALAGKRAPRNRSPRPRRAHRAAIPREAGVVGQGLPEG
jgi:hypothetical protein